ncbi:MAG: YHS domain-containing protein [Cyclobacteriaceae bacterium]
MEKYLSFFMIDLSGYTALTEKHGGKTAARVISRFVHLVKSIIASPCEISERTGDELVITSKNPDALVSLVRNIKKKVEEQVNFPSFHGGLHSGEIYIFDNHFFGSSINLTSRLLNHAQRGQVLASEDFLRSINKKNASYFKKLGKAQFKNILEPVALYTLQSGSDMGVDIDPVCRMQVQNTNNKLSWPGDDGHTHYFCSQECLLSFKQNPRAYLGQ